MFRLAYEVLKDFGTLGVTIVQFGVILFVIYKFATNHWKHLIADVKEIMAKQDKQEEKIGKLGERVSTIEGQLK